MSSVSRTSPAAAIEVLQLEGAFDMASVPEAADAFDAALDRGARAVIFDLRDVTFLDSTMLNLLQQAHRRLRGELLIVRPSSEQAWRVFEVTMLDRLFASFRSLESALLSATGARRDRQVGDVSR
jgi:anti-anti-sigma factor